jgi:hypothetical protein
MGGMSEECPLGARFARRKVKPIKGRQIPADQQRIIGQDISKSTL